MNRLKGLDIAALVLLIIGGLNWGLWALFEFNLVAAIFGELSVLSRIIYLIVAISAIYAAFRTPYMAHTHEGHPAERGGAHPAG
ncbi:MAG: DUF378 domain-containing protein [Planctomycetota bacterium]